MIETQRRRPAFRSHPASNAATPLEFFLTVQWALTRFAGIGPRGYQHAVAATIEALRHWGATRDFRLRLISVREHTPCKGEHWHALAHVPEEHRKSLRSYLRQYIGARKGALCAKNAWEPLGALAYIFKGGTDPARDLLGVPETYERDQGRIAGKRVFISETLNVAAREPGFVRRNARAELKRVCPDWIFARSGELGHGLRSER